MKKLCIALIVLFLISGASSVLAEESSDIVEEVEVTASGGGSSGVQLVTAVSTPTVTSQQVYVINVDLIGELERLMSLLEEAEEEGDELVVQELEGKIRGIKEQIQSEIESCERTSSQIVQPTPIAIELVSSPGIVRDSCDYLEDLEEKKKYYEGVYELSDEELVKKGYSDGKEEIKMMIDDLGTKIEKLKVECESGTGSMSSSGGAGMGGGSVVVSHQTSEGMEPTLAGPIHVSIAKPVAVDSGEEITDYYKFRITNVMTKDVEVEEQIAELKELRGEIDELIEELIKNRDEISAEEIRGLVTEITIRPNEIQADNVVVKTTGKNVVVKVNEKDLVIQPTETGVIVHDENLEIKALELSIKNEVLVVGSSEVKLTAGDLVEKMQVVPKEIELVEADDKAVYKITADENRNLLGIIPVTVETSFTVDAANPEAEIIEEEMPWWTFLTTE